MARELIRASLKGASMGVMTHDTEVWPDIPYADWQDTCATLHMWTQIVGKIRLALAPFENQWWEVVLYLTSRGLSTSPMPYGDRHFSIDFDFIDHRLVIRASDGARSDFALAPMTVADFYRELMGRLDALGLSVKIWTMPVEIVDAIPFEQDTVHASYDPDAVNRFWRALLQSAHVMHVFRSGFVGKASPVHFFWGSFDLAVTRFSGRGAPPHPGGVPNLADWVVREAYSQEVSSCGFWPGNGGFGKPAFYAYAYPEPAGFAEASAGPKGGYYDKTLREFVLPYDAVREGGGAAALLGFLQSTYVAAADEAHWDRKALERHG